MTPGRRLEDEAVVSTLNVIEETETELEQLAERAGNGVRKRMGEFMNEHGDPEDFDPFTHLEGREHVRGGTRADLHEVANTIYDALRNTGRVTVPDGFTRSISGVIGTGTAAEYLVYDYYLEFIRDEFERNEHLDIRIEGGFTVDRAVAIEGGYIEEKTSTGRIEFRATDKLKQEIARDVVDDSWDYRNTHGFGRFDNTVERYASATCRSFVTLADTDGRKSLNDFGGPFSTKS